MRRFLVTILLTITLATATQAMPLSSFSAVGQSRQVLVRWELAAPMAIARFDLLRNGLTAARIPAGTGGTSYEWSDNEVQNDQEYSYLLVGVMSDGSREEFGTVTATPAFDAAVVREYKLHQNFPNPFNPETTISIDLADDGPAVLTVYDVLGQAVAKPFAGTYAKGRYTVLFSGRDLPSGVYFYQLQAGNYVDQKKMVLLK